MDLVKRLAEFERKYDALMQNKINLSVEGQAIGIALLTTLHTGDIAAARTALSTDPCGLNDYQRFMAHEFHSGARG